MHGKNFVALLATLACLTMPALAAEEEAPPAKPWSLNLSFSLTTTSGNADSANGSLGLDYKRDWGQWNIHATANAVQAETEGVTTAENYAAQIALDRKLAEHWSLSIVDTYGRDPFAGVDLRYALNLGARYSNSPSEGWDLAFFFGGGYEFEEFVGGTDGEHAIARLDLENAWKLKSKSTFTQKLATTTNLDDTEDYRLALNLALTAPVTDLLALQLSYDVQYDNVPVPGAKKTDTTLFASIVVTLKNKEASE